VQALIARYQAKGILLDSNLLVLLFVGLADINKIKDFKRTRNQGFTEKEFSLLENIVKGFSKIVATPHILTEASNFIFELHGETLQSALRVITGAVQSFKERRTESKILIQTEAFFNFGLADSAILDIPAKKYLVLSVDAALVIALQKKGVDAINFNHLRLLDWHQ
jgi:hypothetical protein